MKTPFCFLLALSLGAFPPLQAQEKKKSPPAAPAPPAPPPAPPPAAVSSLGVHDLAEFDALPGQIQSLIQSSLALTRLELGYLYGSHEPAKGGMDCSGAVYHVLKFQGLKDVPRQSDDMCRWVEKKSQLHLTPTAAKFNHAEFDGLRPGDLLFWTNTAETTRKLPVTHVMIYLGKLKKNGKPVVFGSSDGRTYESQRRSGVSVFDFHIPAPDNPKRLHGYGPVPGLLPAVSVKKPIIAASPPAAVKPATPAPAPAVKTPPPKTVPATPNPATPKEEVRKAIASAPAASAESKPALQPKVTTPPPRASAKPKSPPAKKTSSAPVKRRPPPPPPKSQVERTLDKAVDSVKRFFKR